MLPKSNLELKWKEFRVYLPELHAWLQQEISGYCGMSAHSKLELHFTEILSDDDSAKIQSRWEDIKQDEESEKFSLELKKARAIELAKENILTATFAKLSPAERKLLMNMPLSEEDKEALVVKFTKKLDDDTSNDNDPLEE